MRPISRRNALLLGGLGVAATAAGGTGLAWTLTGQGNPGAPAPAGGTAFSQPPEERSSAGLLQVRLTAAPGPVRLADREANALSYNGSIPGPTLRLKPGDTLKIALANNLAQATNLHLHGLHVSPEGNGDNVFVHVEPGRSFDYEYRLPNDHPPGVYWYHPHVHGTVADQIFAGLFGAIIVEDPVPAGAGTERLLVVSDTALDGLGSISPVSDMERMMGREGGLVLVNGQLSPRFTARPGEQERWRILNACVSRYLRLRLDGQQLQLLGIDSNRGQDPEDVQELVLAPGNRADLLVTTRPGESVLFASPYDRGSMAGMMGRGFGRPAPQEDIGATALATLSVSGEAAVPPAASQPRAAPRDLRQSAVAAHRQFTMDMGMGMGMAGGMMRFTINGREYDADRTDTSVAAGSVEEWTIINTSPMDHPFHLHVWPMQVMEDGRQPGAPMWRDVVNVPANGRVTVRVAFEGFRGRSVYHCHILDHEDLGMMGVIDVR
ncbi:multicopper oxidase family protein [Arthrobacter sp. AD-310]